MINGRPPKAETIEEKDAYIAEMRKHITRQRKLISYYKTKYDNKIVPESKKDAEIKTITKAYKQIKKTGRTPKEIEDERRARILLKHPKYYYSFSGYPIFKLWCEQNKIKMADAGILVTLSYFETFKLGDVQHFVGNKGWVKTCLKNLVDIGYVCRDKNRNMVYYYFLSATGKALEKSYEAFYDKHTRAINKAIRKREKNIYKKTSDTIDSPIEEFWLTDDKDIWKDLI